MSEPSLTELRLRKAEAKLARLIEEIEKSLVPGCQCRRCIEWGAAIEEAKL